MVKRHIHLTDGVFEMTMDNILYELFIYSEWRPDPDYLVCSFDYLA